MTGISFTFSLCHAPASHYLPKGVFCFVLFFTLNCRALEFASGDLAFAVDSGSPLDHLILKAGKSCIPRFHRTLRLRLSSWYLPSPGHRTDSWLKDSPSIARKWERDLLAYPKVLDSGADFQPGTHLERSMEVFSRNRSLWTPSMLPPSASLPVAALSKRGAYKSVWHPNFCSCC